MFRAIGFCGSLLLAGAAWAAMSNDVVPSTPALAMQPVVLETGEPRVSLAGYLEWLKDESGGMTLDEVRQRDDFKPLRGNLSAGFTDAAVWLRFDVRSEARAPVEWVLELTNAVLDDVRLFVPRGDGTYLQQRSGEDLPREQWMIDYRSPSFRLHCDVPEARRYYLRLWTRNAVTTRIIFWQSEAFAAAKRAEALTHGIIYGIFLLVLAFQLFFWLLTRTQLGAWYLAYAAITWLASSIADGYFQRLTGLSGVQSDLILGMSLGLGLGVGASFMLAFLELGTVMPRFTRIYLPLIRTIGIMAALVVLAGKYGAGVGLAQGGILANIVIMTAINVSLAVRGYRPSRFFLVVFGLFEVALLLRITSNFGFFPPSFSTDQGVQIAALVHMIAMSMRVTYQYNQLRRENLERQAALAASLETQVKDRTAELTEEINRRELLEQELRRALEAEVDARNEQQDFVAMVSHEFRTPLAIINTVAQQIARNIDVGDVRNLRRCFNIRESVRRMTGMMDTFLTLNRVDTRFHLNLSTSNARQMLDTLTMEWDADQLEVRYESLPETIDCDVGLVRMVVRNLIGNALRFTPSQVSVKFAARGTENGDMEITVADEGAGIPDDEIPKLFQKYFRGKASQTHPGAGLGLYLVAHIAELHGGAVRAESALGKGSTFVFTLPGR
jgi:signal transduction histidine kinase